jgi:hypothetical protein
MYNLNVILLGLIPAGALIPFESTPFPCLNALPPLAISFSFDRRFPFPFQAIE